MHLRRPRDRHVSRTARWATTIVAVLGLILGTAVPATAAATPVGAAAATAVGGPVKASLAGFSPGNIISDAVFTDRATMTEAQIQTFFNSKVKTCRAGYTCLKDYRTTSVTRPADNYCRGYAGAANESAARIIYRVAQACDINPQVLIVMLQKEQGLINHTWPSQWRYDAALGQACPDTAPCDPKFVGFFHQIYGAARQMQIYMEGRYFQWYKAGQTWQIQWHPDRARCGTGPVYIANKATEALYYYTPYQPNAAAMRAGYGTGDSCSSYGNRNFYNYFTDWFGPTNYALRSAIQEAWDATGGSEGPLGRPSADERYDTANGGGYVQEFQRGTIWLSKGATTAFAMGNGPLRQSYLDAGGPAGAWGWMTSAPRCGLIDGGCLTVFQNGTVGYSAATGAVLIGNAAISGEWNRVGATTVGFPAAPARCGLIDGGCLQEFQRATVGYSPSTGAMVMSPAVAAGWNKYGANALGYPTTAAVVTDANGGGETQAFSRGTLWASGSGAFTLAASPIRHAYLAAGGPSSGFGWPAGASRCGMVNGGCLLPVSNGTLAYSPATGAVLIPDSVAREWNRLGAVKLGYPINSAATAAGATSQRFGNGRVFASATATVTIMNGKFLDAYLAAGGAASPAGAPTGSARCGLIDGGCLMTTVNGTVGYSAATGVVLMAPAVAAEWNRVGAVKLGYPTKAAAVSETGSLSQPFSRGAIFTSSTGARTIMNSTFLSAYLAAAPVVKSGGAPLAQPRCGMIDGGCLLPVEKGTVAYSPATGTLLLPGPIAAEWNRVGAVRLGYPVKPAVITGEVITQQFQRGTVVHDGATGVTSIR